MISTANPNRFLSAGRGRFNVLVIDDHHGFRQYLCRHLRALGFKTLEAKTGDEGLSLARRHKPALVFLDMCLGFKSRLSGSDTLRILKAEEATRNISVVAMSGIKESPGDEAQIRRDGADEFFTKAEIAADPKNESPFLRRLSALLLLDPAGAGPATIPLSDRVGIRSPAARQYPIPRNHLGLILTVLVIDDDEETAEMMRMLFSRQPMYRVLSANSGAQGLRMAACEFPDLIILDLIMPGMSGQEVCRRLREQEKTFHPPILILTADMRIKQEINCIDLGADDYLVKPVAYGRLMARIRSLIRRYRFRGNSEGVIKRGAVSLEITTHRLTLMNRRPIALTPTESALCALLMSAEGKFVDKRVLHKKIYNSWPALRSAVIKVHIKNIREKLGDFGVLITSCKEQGYGFNIEYAGRLQ